MMMLAIKEVNTTALANSRAFFMWELSLCVQDLHVLSEKNNAPTQI